MPPEGHDSDRQNIWLFFNCKQLGCAADIIGNKQLISSKHVNLCVPTVIYTPKANTLELQYIAHCVSSQIADIWQRMANYLVVKRRRVLVVTRLAQATQEYSSVEFWVLSMYCLSISISMHFLIIEMDGAKRACNKMRVFNMMQNTQYEKKRTTSLKQYFSGCNKVQNSLLHPPLLQNTLQKKDTFTLTE